MPLASRMREDGSRQVTALLGPTNTGKTHRALQRMLAYPTGMIGLPLRLLAREVYDRLVVERGADKVALVTGEEKRVPPGARWFVCTVEAMPVDRRVAFVAIDEVQLAGDRRRGRVFTERLLDCRGLEETHWLGSLTAEPLLRRLEPSVQVETQERFSKLSHTGPAKLAQLPPRSALVAFSAEEVYALAEKDRAKTGGVAVVLGALSPRTRNAQVAMYQAGEVKHLVATDAIGMGLNLDVHHVAFSGLRKFDGARHRDLEVPELAQIAGRAGRFTQDGTFGTLLPGPDLDPADVLRIENHQFDRLKRLWWRNARLDFSSLRDLKASLEVAPPEDFLAQVKDDEDELALEVVLRDPELVGRARLPDQVAQVWEACRIPDYRKSLTHHHGALVKRIAGYLLTDDAVIPDDWMSAHLGRLDAVDGDIETLTSRIAHVRTLVYLAFRPGWVDRSRHWQETTRAVEDRLSDALHQRLTERFVDRRVLVLVDSPGSARFEVLADGLVRVDGLPVARLMGLSAEPLGDGPVSRKDSSGKAAWRAVQKHLEGEVEARIERLLEGTDAAFQVDHLKIMALGGEIARIERGDEPLRPRARLLSLELASPRSKEQLGLRLRTFIDHWVAAGLGPWIVAESVPGLSVETRKVLVALRHGLGWADDVGPVPKRDRVVLEGIGIRFGRGAAWVESLQDGPGKAFVGRLLAIHRSRPEAGPARAGTSG